MRLDVSFLKKVLPEAEIVQGKLPQDVVYSVDSRLLLKNHLFFALPGARVDGHQFLQEALDKGAGIVIASEKKDLLHSLSSADKDTLIIVVKNPEQALIALASAWRSEFSYPIAAITGSVGKTTTKELTAHFLKTAGKKYAVSQGNLNTLIGVAISISTMNPEQEGALFEIGISKPGEMEKIVALLRPTVGLITYIAHTHMEGLGTIVDIAHEKRMLFKYFLSDSIGIVNGDQSLLSAVSYPHPVVRFGLKMINQIQARKIKENSDGTVSFMLNLYNQKIPVTLMENHKGILINILASVALSYQLGVSEEIIKQGLFQLPARKQRFEICTLKNNLGRLIDDCYNASPESVKAALLAFEKMKNTGKKIAVLGDMLELGETSSFWHRQIGRFLRKIPTLNHLILIGKDVSWIEKTAPSFVKIQRVPSWQDAISLLSATVDKDALILVKGSRGMQLHHVVEAFVDKQKQN